MKNVFNYQEREKERNGKKNVQNRKNETDRDQEARKENQRKRQRVRGREKASWSIITGVEYVLTRTGGHGGTEVTCQSRGPLTSSELEGVLKPI